MRKGVMVLFLALFFISLTSAAGQVGSCYDIQIISNSSAMNISSISYPNSTVVVSSQVMNKTDKTFNYTFCSTTLSGDYSVLYYDAQGNVNSTFFTITPSGTAFDLPQAIIYALVLIAMFGFLLLSLWGAITIQWKNNSESGQIVSVNDLKYLKVFCVVMSYLFIMWIAGIMHSISFNFLLFSGAETFFRYIFEIMLRFIIPIIVISFVWVIFFLIDDQKIRNDLKRMGDLGMGRRER